MIRSMLDDLRQAWRGVAANRTVSLMVVGCLTVGLAANTAITSVVDAMLLAPLPYPDDHRLVRIYETGKAGERTFRGSVSVPNLADWRETARSFDGVAGAAFGSGFAWDNGAEPERLAGSHVEPELLTLLGRPPLHGRLFSRRDIEGEAGDRQVVISHRLWQRAFGADPAAIGATLTLDGATHALVGVMPPDFDFPAGHQVDVWKPLVFSERQKENRGWHWMSVVARLSDDVLLPEAQAEMDGIAARLREAYPDDQSERGVLLVPLRDSLVGSRRTSLLILWVAVGLVLAISCANATNLLLARATARRQEVTVRVALGAGPLRLRWQLLLEGLLLAGSAGALGTLLGVLGARWLWSLPGSGWRSHVAPGMEPHTLALCLGATILTGIIAGLAPAWGIDRSDTALGGGSRHLGDPGERLRGSLVVAELALAVVVVAGAMLVGATVRTLLAVDPGFNDEGVLTAHVAWPETTSAEESIGRWRRLLDVAQTVPGVREAGVVDLLPTQNWGSNGGFFVEGRPLAETASEQPFSERRTASRGYFSALGIELLDGRLLRDSDDLEAPAVAVVNRALAERYWPGQSPVGARIFFDREATEEELVTIVGVVENVRDEGLDRPTDPSIYFSVDQAVERTMVLVVRTVGPPRSVLPALQRSIGEAFPGLPLHRVRTMREVLGEHLSPRRFLLTLLGSFSLVALVLAVAGIYGVLSYSVARRQAEIGVRLALGARGADILSLVLRRALLWSAAGGVLGGLLSLGFGRLLRSQLVGVGAVDPQAFGLAILLLLTATLCAAAAPALRASRVSPRRALSEGGVR